MTIFENGNLLDSLVDEAAKIRERGIKELQKRYPEKPYNENEELIHLLTTRLSLAEYILKNGPDYKKYSGLSREFGVNF